MKLIDLKKHIESFPNGKRFSFGLSDPFSWRGDYSEVAFSVLETPMSRAEILEKIERALNEEFIGYKGGEYRYNENTPVNFEKSARDWSDGNYAADFFLKLAFS
jgi:hypothetical protein